MAASDPPLSEEIWYVASNELQYGSWMRLARARAERQFPPFDLVLSDGRLGDVSHHVR